MSYCNYFPFNNNAFYVTNLCLAKFFMWVVPYQINTQLAISHHPIFMKFTLEVCVCLEYQITNS